MYCSNDIVNNMLVHSLEKRWVMTKEENGKKKPTTAHEKTSTARCTGKKKKVHVKRAYNFFLGTEQGHCECSRRGAKFADNHDESLARVLLYADTKL